MADDPQPRHAPERGRPESGLAAGTMDGLVETLVPGLVKRLRGSVDEIEVARDGWRVRVRRGGVAIATGESASVLATPIPRAGAISGGNGAVPSAVPHVPHPPQLPHPAHPPRQHTPHVGARSAAAPGRVVATSPAVGVFMPRGDVGPGARVAAGDRLGIVDLLGVPQDVLAPTDGILALTLVEPGEGVEYGQELLVIEAAT